MSDKVVDRLMRRRGSRGIGWLKQPPTVEQCETIPNRRFVMILWSEEIDDCVERSRHSWWNQTTGHWRLDTYTISWIQNWWRLECDLIFTLWQHSVSWQVQCIVQFIPLNAATNTNTALDGTLASTYFGEMHHVLRCKFSIHREMLGDALASVFFCVVVMSCISFYRHFRRPHRTIVCVIELNSSACGTTQDALWIVTFLLGPCSRMFINPFTAGTHYTGFRAKFGRAPARRTHSGVGN